jgi:hypothetical protein
LTVTDTVSATLVRLPLWSGMPEQMLDRVVEGVTSF